VAINRKASGAVAYISHGGGPLPLLGDEAHRELVESLRQLTEYFPRPSTLVVISAHWEAGNVEITAGENPPLIYDYYGFPEESYEIQYPAPGNPTTARRIYDLLTGAGIEATLNKTRGFDHGLFVPLKIMYPEANIPCVQVSLIKGLSAAEHLQLGAALTDLIADDVLILGSGFSFHNMSAFFSPVTEEVRSLNVSFDRWLIDTCRSSRLTEGERASRLKNWENAPAARFCHPREEHLLPLHVCCGIAKSPASRTLHFEVMGIKASAIIWQ
jgi:aromatic ring-opening dioxygenase catalytic subunit (LigB family)